MENITYNSEEEFLKAYNPEDYDRLSVTADILLFSVSSENTENYRKTDEKKMSILLVKRTDYPYKDKWCLPGGFVGVGEELDYAPNRILKKETNLDDIYLEQLYTFGGVKRDPRMRIISVSYMALVDKTKIENILTPTASWFDIISYEEKDGVVNVILDNGTDVIKFAIAKHIKPQATDKYDMEILDNNSLAFDHEQVILTGLERLRNKIEYTDIVFNMMPELFTLGELQKVYEAILGKKLLDPAFRRIIANKVEKTDIMKTGGGHRPSVMFRYKKESV